MTTTTTTTLLLLLWNAGECPLVLENPPPAYPPPLRKKATALALLQFLPDLKHNFRFLILADTELVLSSFFFYTSSLSTKMKICCCCYYCCCCKLWAEPVSYSCCASSYSPISTEKMRLYTFPPFLPLEKILCRHILDSGQNMF